MDWEVILQGLGLLIFGLLFVSLGLDGWRYRRAGRISLLEGGFLKAAGDKKPLPANRWDRILAYIQPILMLVFGPLMIVSGFAVLLVLGE